MMVMDGLDMSNQGLSATKGIGENFGSLRPTRPGVHGGRKFSNVRRPEHRSSEVNEYLLGNNIWHLSGREEERNY